ncbi:MAG: hypothetical protein ACFCU4_05125 [Puniceicoccaceae bacterium]
MNPVLTQSNSTEAWCTQLIASASFNELTPTAEISIDGYQPHVLLGPGGCFNKLGALKLEKPGDLALYSFSARRDEGCRLPYIKPALAVMSRSFVNQLSGT